jgi:hypothetical protein
MAKRFITVLGVVFIVAGIAGFISGLRPDGKVFGIFFVGDPGTVHNLVHLLSGVVALVAANSGEVYARLYAKVFGVVYALVTIAGFVVGNEGKVFSFLPVNQADNVLHLVIATALLYFGFSTVEKARRPATPAEA